MKNTRIGSKEVTRKKQNQGQKKTRRTVEVLYQKMGDRWFAFSLIGDEVFVGSVSQSEIDMPRQGKVSKKIAGNS